MNKQVRLHDFYCPQCGGSIYRNLNQKLVPWGDDGNEVFLTCVDDTCDKGHVQQQAESVCICADNVEVLFTKFEEGALGICDFDRALQKLMQGHGCQWKVG